MPPHLLTASLFIVLSLLYLPSPSESAKRGTLKRRLAASTDDDEPVANPSSSSNAPPDRRPRGGVQQRLRANAADQPPTIEKTRPTPLNDNLKRRWAKGEISSAAVQDLAKDAQIHGAHSLEAISGVGGGGKYAQNMFREYRRAVRVARDDMGRTPIEIRS